MTKQIVIGDIHGCFDEFLELLDNIGVSEEDTIISVGDLIDRGPKSIDLFHFFKNRKNAINILGNHERKHLRGILSYSQEIVKVQFGNEYESLIEWLKTLPYFHETEDAIIVHAAVEHNLEMCQQKENVMSGSTSGDKYLQKKYGEEYWYDFINWEKPIIFGHHIVGEKPLIHENNVYGIDTGACHGGYLTAITLPDFKVYQVKVSQDYWVSQKKEWQVEVLKNKPWESYPITKIETEISKYKRNDNPQVLAFILQIEQWKKEVEELSHKIFYKISEEVDEILQKFGKDNFNQQATKSSYKSLLFLHLHKSLSADKILDNYKTSSRIIELAKLLGINEIPSLQNKP